MHKDYLQGVKNSRKSKQRNKYRKNKFKKIKIKIKKEKKKTTGKLHKTAKAQRRGRGL